MRKNKIVDNYELLENTLTDQDGSILILYP